MSPIEAINLLESDINDPDYDMTDCVEAVQCLIDSAVIWELQGSYQQLAFDMLNDGLVSIPDNYTATLERRQRSQFPEVFNT